MGCGASSEKAEAKKGRGRYGGRLHRRGTQTLTPDLLLPKAKENRQDVDGTPIVHLEQRPGIWCTSRTRLPAKLRLSEELQHVARGHATIMRGPPEMDGAALPKAVICPDFAGQFLMNITAAEAELLRTTTVPQLQKMGAVAYQGAFSVEYTSNGGEVAADPAAAAPALSIGVMSPRSTNRKRRQDARAELAAVEEALNHLVTGLVVPRVAKMQFRGASLRLLASYDDPVLAVGMMPSEREVTVSLRYQGPKLAPRRKNMLNPPAGTTPTPAEEVPSPPRRALSKRHVFLHSINVMRVVDVFTGDEVGAYKNPTIGPKQPLKVLPPNPRGVVYYQEEGSLVTYHRGKLELWDTVKRTRVKELSGDRHFDEMDNFSAAKVSPCGKYLAVGGEINAYLTGGVSLYSGTMQVLNFMDHCRKVTALDFSPCSGFIASADQTGEVLVWSVQTGVWRARGAAHNHDVLAVVFTSNDTLVTVCKQYLKCWRLVAVPAVPGKSLAYQVNDAEGELQLVWQRSVAVPSCGLPNSPPATFADAAPSGDGWADHDTRRQSVFSDSRSTAPSGGVFSPKSNLGVISPVPAKRKGSHAPTLPSPPVWPCPAHLPQDASMAQEFTSAALTPCHLLAVTQDTSEILLMDHATGIVLHSVHTRGVPTSLAPGRAMCAVGDSLGNVYALDMDAHHSLPGPSNPLINTATPGTPRRSVFTPAEAPQMRAGSRASKTNMLPMSP